MNKTVSTLLAYLLGLSTAYAGTIARPAKTCGTTTYVDEVAAACTTIKSSELDADFAEVYDEFNGNISTANILDGTIAAADIATGAVETTEILDGTIANADVSASADIAGSKLATGAATKNAGTAATCTASLAGVSSETTLWTSSALTTAAGASGSRVMLAGTCAIYGNSAGSGSTYRFTFKRDGSSIATLDYAMSAVAATFIPLPSPSLYIDTAHTAASHTYTLTIQRLTGDIIFYTDGSDPGTMIAVELR